jgi:hypothetical protein
MENNKLTRKQKVNYLIENTTQFPNNPVKDFWGDYLNHRLDNNHLSHKELDEMIDYCNETKGKCLFSLYFEK